MRVACVLSVKKRNSLDVAGLIASAPPGTVALTCPCALIDTLAQRTVQAVRDGGDEWDDATEWEPIVVLHKLTDILAESVWGVPSRPVSECACSRDPAHVLALLQRIEADGPRVAMHLLQPIDPLLALIDRESMAGVLTDALSPLGITVPSSHTWILDPLALQALVVGDEDAGPGDLAALSFPLVVKAVPASSSKTAHRLMLVPSRDTLATALLNWSAEYCASVHVRPPGDAVPITDSDGALAGTLCSTCSPSVILQTFINHPSGRVHKVYACGSVVEVCTKPSIRDISTGAELPGYGLTFTANDIPRPLQCGADDNGPSSSASLPHDAVADDVVADEIAWVANAGPAIADAVRAVLGIDLFGVDIIVGATATADDTAGQAGHAGRAMYALDINYFPSFGHASHVHDELLALARSRAELEAQPRQGTMSDGPRPSTKALTPSR